MVNIDFKGSMIKFADKGRVINKEVSLDELNFNTIPTPGSMVI